VFNIKRAVNVSIDKINGLKSHDYLIIIERLMPVNADLWKIFVEFSYFYE
jgi:hypothetical protein